MGAQAVRCHGNNRAKKNHQKPTWDLEKGGKVEQGDKSWVNGNRSKNQLFLKKLVLWNHRISDAQESHNALVENSPQEKCTGEPGQEKRGSTPEEPTKGYPTNRPPEKRHVREPPG